MSKLLGVPNNDLLFNLYAYFIGGNYFASIMLSKMLILRTINFIVRPSNIIIVKIISMLFEGSH